MPIVRDPSVTKDLRSKNQNMLDQVRQDVKDVNHIFNETLAQQQKLDALLAEADGARMKAKAARDQRDGILGTSSCKILLPDDNCYRPVL